MNKIEKTIKERERSCYPFKPNKAFYDAISVNRKRWRLIRRGEVPPTIDELKAIAAWFEVPITELF